MRFWIVASTFQAVLTTEIEKLFPTVQTMLRIKADLDELSEACPPICFVCVGCLFGSFRPVFSYVIICLARDRTPTIAAR